MRISRIQIENFRNFQSLDFSVAEHAVIVGENKVGKSNLLEAIRLVLDPSLPDSARALRMDDFWDGLPRPLAASDRIRISVHLADFRNQPAHLALLADYLIQVDPMIASLTYEFGPSLDLAGPPTKEADYEYRIYGGNDTTKVLDSRIRRRMPLLVLPAMRDVEDTLSSWRRSPLRPLLDDAASQLGRDTLVDLATRHETLARELEQMPEISELGDRISRRLLDMVGDAHSVPVHLGFAPTDPERLIRAVRLLIDARERTLAEASLGSANLLYFTLKLLELDLSVRQARHDHTFLAIEEPEAHLHPHVQRLVYRSVLQPRAHLPGGDAVRVGGDPDDRPDAVTLLLTTHSPYIVSVSPVRSLVLLRNDAHGATGAVSAASLPLSRVEEEDLERYLDVTRGEVVFARGVILVEGEAELYLFPVFAAAMGYDLDRLGITVSSVAGTNFVPHVKLLGPSGLHVPLAVVTDADPQPTGHPQGYVRAANLLPIITPQAAGAPPLPGPGDADLVATAAAAGIFLNDRTLEVELFRSGHHRPMMRALHELTGNRACRERCRKWAADPTSVDESRMLKDIERVGKGRFAQRLVSQLDKNIDPPAYIRDAIGYLVGRIR